MYRVKTFNGLVAKIYDRLLEISNFPKRVEYHLLGKLGLIQCVKEYIIKANQKNDYSIFNFYQTAEVLTSVVSAFEKNQLQESNHILAEFSKQALIELEKFDADKSVIGQTNEYIKHLKTLVNDIVNRDLT
jgi:hypothetical protein